MTQGVVTVAVLAASSPVASDLRVWACVHVYACVHAYARVQCLHARLRSGCGGVGLRSSLCSGGSCFVMISRRGAMGVEGRQTLLQLTAQ